MVSVVFPWVLSNYQGTKLDLSDPDNFRNLSLPMGALDADRLAQFQENYDTLDDPLIPKFFYGSHYSTMAGVVLYFLVRLEPFTSLHVKMQDGHFDYPDRLFTSGKLMLNMLGLIIYWYKCCFKVEQTWDMCTSNLSEVKELIPEFYCQPAFLQNINRFKFGTTQDRREVNDVLLPPWANGCAEEFVQVMRSALESEFVSAGLNNWIDLIFGHKQKGPAAVKAQNVFYYLTYPGAVDLDKISDPAMQEATVLQIAHFGQCPVQILTEPHVPRGSLPLYRTPPTLTAAMQQSFSFSSTFHGKRRIKLKQMFPQMYKSGKASPSSKSFVAAWSSDETIFACACPAIGVVDVAFTPVDDSNRELIVTFAAAATPITGLSLSNEFLVTAAADTDLCVWRLGSVGEDRGVCAEAFLRLFGHLSPILGVQVVQDRNVVVSVSQGSILVHSLYDGQLLKRYPVRNDVIVSGIRYNKYSGHISADLEDKEQIADLSIKSETLDP